MSFITDKQTLDDLNLPGKYKPGSVFSLFNQVNTIGGEKLLEDMFRNPLTNAGEINRCSSIFKYLLLPRAVVLDNESRMNCSSGWAAKVKRYSASHFW